MTMVTRTGHLRHEVAWGTLCSYIQPSPLTKLNVQENAELSDSPEATVIYPFIKKKLYGVPALELGKPGLLGEKQPPSGGCPYWLSNTR